MKNNHFTYLLLLLCFGLSSCDDINLTFDAPFPRKNRDLSKILGNELLIKRGNDTLIWEISSDRKGNLITNKKKGDTLFLGTVSKYRGLYYFSHQVNDSSYMIYAVKTGDNVVYGINSAWAQISMIENEINKGNYPKLVKYIISKNEDKIIRLHPDKREMKRLFTVVMDSIPADTILPSKEANTIEPTAVAVQTDPDDFENLSKVYPNPTKDFINVELQQKNVVEYQLLNLSGSVVLNGQFTDVLNKIDLSGQTNGAYLLTLVSSKTKQKEAVRIIKTK